MKRTSTLFMFLWVGCAAPTHIGATLQPIPAPTSNPTSAPAPTKIAGPCLYEFDFNVDGVMDGRRAYLYNTQGLLEREDFVSLGHGALPSSSKHKYDADGNQIESILVFDDKPYTRFTSTYEDKKLIKQERVLLNAECASGPKLEREHKTVIMPGGDPKRPARTEEYVIEYDLCNGKDGWLQERISYSYEAGASRPKTKTQETFTAGELVPKSYTINFSYDASGRVQEELYTADFYRDGYAKVKYSWSSPREQRIEYDMNLDGVFERSTIMLHNTAGDVTQEERFDGTKLTWRRSVFYDALGRKIKEEVDGSGTNKADGEADHRSVYQYECKP